MIAGTNGKKRPRGRPVQPAPEPIPDTPENIIKTVMRTRSKAERDRIQDKARTRQINNTIIGFRDGQLLAEALMEKVKQVFASPKQTA